ncbi:hypothetical protein [Microvirga puerhi]|uniref:Uncharacterized protein n=1 Tax=Microvirga puerhi TaxID=2876078 RepID=A0ABS7VMT3_9HYPH|nr:hypothetical protein [Microvirga puerhi]MBZ6076858.1 hypothetical protein [Microvirga puerhi]
MTMRTTLGTAQQLHLSRAARTAGEAFAFDEPEILAQPSQGRWSLGLFIVALAIVAVAAIYVTVR